MAASDFHVFVGAETGLLKHVEIPSSKWENVNSIDNVQRSNEICVMCFDNQDDNAILLGTRGGLVKIYNAANHTIEDKLQVTDNDKHILKGLFKWDNKYVTCTGSGLLQVWDEELSSDDQIRLECGADLCCMKPDLTALHKVGTGGKENDLKLWDLNVIEKGPVFKAKNVRDDFLDLRVPVWVNDVAFVPGSNQVLTCTAYSKVRMYDTATSRRPVMDIEWGQCPITRISVCSNARQCIIGNARGFQALVDLRMKRVMQSYKGGSGSIRAIQCHPSKPIVASCGLDRYLRVHNIETSMLLNKVYLKSRLNCLLIANEWESITKTEQDSSEVKVKEEVDQDDELWDSLETVTPKEAVKRKVDEPKTIQKRKSKKPSKIG